LEELVEYMFEIFGKYISKGAIYNAREIDEDIFPSRRTIIYLDMLWNILGNISGIFRGYIV